MKKLALILAIAIIAAFTAPAFAADVTIGGAYRVTATKTDTGLTGGSADVTQNFQHRLRIPITFKVNDNIIAYARADWNERDYWGDTSATFTATGQKNNVMVDYAWVQITQPMWDAKVGRQWVMFGQGSLYNPDGLEGILLNLHFDPVTVTMNYGKRSENGSKNDDGINADADNYAIQIAYAGDNFKLGGMAGYVIDRGVSAAYDSKKIGYGFFVDYKMDAFTFNAEADFITGDKTTTVDYEGTNLYANLSYMASDALTLGIAAVYGKGNNDANKDQLSSITATTDADFRFFDYAGPLALDEFSLLGNGPFNDDKFELANDAGIQAFKIYADYKLTEAIVLHGLLAYATPEEDAATVLDDLTVFIGSVDYSWMPNVTLSFGMVYGKPDYTNNTNDDASKQFVGKFNVDF